MSNTNPLQLLRSSTANKRPLAAGLVDGRPAINTNSASPGLFFKDSTGGLVKVGPVHVGTTAPNVSPASGGATGNSVGEQWLDTTGGTYVLKIWDGSAWRSESGTFVDVNGDVMTGALVMDNQQQVRFRETTANGTNYIALQAPASVASDKTITLPDVNGTVVTTGDTGTVTSTMIADGAIVNADVNTSAAIAGTKISPDFGSQNVVTTGTSTAASFIPTSSTVPTNGVYLPAANSVALSTNGTGRLFVDANGTVRVNSATQATSDGGLNVEVTSNGSSSAPFTLQNRGTSNGTGVFLAYRGLSSASAETDYAYMQMLATDTSSRQGAIAFWTANGGSVNERLRITSAGLVGIGTSSPSKLLTIGNSSTANTTVRLNCSQTAGSDTGMYSFGIDDSTDFAGMRLDFTDRTSKGLQIFTAPGFGYPISFSGSSGNQDVTIDTSGRVGIGTTSPTQRLQITDGSLSNFYIAPGYNSGQGTLLATGGSEYLAFATNGLANERLRITSAGLVGIGTSSPNYQLHCTTSFAVGASGFNQQLTFSNDTIQSLLLGTGYTALKLNPLGGNVGIGTSSPNGLLDVRSATTWIGDGTTDAFLQFNQSATAANRWHIGTGASNALIFYKGTYGSGSETARIDSSGRLGIGTASPSYALDVSGQIRAAASSTLAQLRLERTGSSTGHSWLGAQSDALLAVLDSSFAEKMRLDSSGRLLVGTSSARTNFYNLPSTFSPQLQVESAGTTTLASLSIVNNVASESYGSALILSKSRGGSVGSNVILLNNDEVGSVLFQGNDGSEFVQVASISAQIDGETGANDMPGRLVFSTTADGASSPTERMRITSAGLVGIGTSSPAWPLDVNGIAKVKQAVLFEATNSTNRWDLYTNTDNTFRFNYNGSGNDEITITSSGNVGIGTTPSFLLDLFGTTPALRIKANGVANGVKLEQSSATGDVELNVIDTYPLIFKNANTERCRLDTSGRLLVGTASVSIGTQLEVVNTTGSAAAFVVSAQSDFPVFCHNKATSGDNGLISFGTEASFTGRGSVTYNRTGGVVAYNTTSDYRAKTILGVIQNPGDTIDALKVYRGVMNGATTERPMLVAHEAQEVAPYCVTGEKDAVDDDGNPIYQQMDHQVLVPLLIAEIQQLRTRVAALEGA